GAAFESKDFVETSILTAFLTEQQLQSKTQPYGIRSQAHVFTDFVSFYIISEENTPEKIKSTLMHFRQALTQLHEPEEVINIHINPKKLHTLAMKDSAEAYGTALQLIFGNNYHRLGNVPETWKPEQAFFDKLNEFKQTLYC